MKRKALSCMAGLAVCAQLAQATIEAGPASYGSEFWKEPAGFDDVANRARHAIQPRPGGGAVITPSYAAGFGETDLLFTPTGSAAVRIRVAEVGGRPLGAAISSWRIVGNTARRPLFPDASVIEHVEARAEGVYLTWIFRHAMAADKPLTLTLAVDGATYAGETMRGHHFSGGDGITRVRIGRAEAVDSTGRRWELASARSGNGIAIRVPVEVLKEAALPFCVDPAVSPEFGMDNVLRALAPAYSEQSVPAAAWGLTNGLVVWQDLRRGGFGEDPEVYGARIGPEGQVLDPVGLRIAPDRTSLEEPAAAWSGERFVVAWKDTAAESNWAIRTVGVTPAGEQPAASIAVHSATGQITRWSPALAFSGTGTGLVAWTDGRSGSADIYGRFVDGTGQPLGTSDFPICTASNAQDYASVAWGGTNYVVAWQDRRFQTGWNEANVVAARVSPAGRVLDTNGLRLFAASGQYGSQEQPGVSWGTGDYLVVWTDSRNGATTSRWDIYGARLLESGQVLGSNTFLVCGATNNQTQPAVTWGGTNHVVTWIDYRGPNAHPAVYGARVTGGAGVLDGYGFAVSTTSTNGAWEPAVLWNGVSFFAAWRDDRRGFEESDIYGAHVQASGLVPDATGILVSASADNQEAPDAAWGATNYLVVWRDNLNGSSSDIYGARVGAAGGILDPAGIAVCTASNKQRLPKVAWGGTNWLVVWEDDRNTNTLVMGTPAYQDIFGARVSSAGQVLDPQGIGICTNPGPQFEPSCAWNGTDAFLVAWRDYRVATLPYPSDIYGGRVAPSGLPLDGMLGLAICTATNFQFRPQVVPGTTNCLVVWEDGRNSTNRYDIYAARVAPTGLVLDAAGIAVSAYPTNKGVPRAAWGGTNWFVLWQDRRNDTDDNDFYGARVSPAGTVLDPAGLAVCTATGHQHRQVIGWSGTNWLAVWDDWRSDYRNRLFGTRIAPSGAVLDGAAAGFELFEEAAGRVDPALAPRSNGLFLLVYTGIRYEGFNAPRTLGCFVDISPLTLQVLSLHGDGAPAVGSHDAVHGLPVTCFLTSATVSVGTTQFACRGWAGTGSASPGGTDTNTGSFVMDADSSVTWLWTTNYYLAVATSGVGTVTGACGWIASGSNAVLHAGQGAHYYFGGWQGDVPGGETNSNPLTLLMSGPRAVVSVFAPYLTTNGVPHWWLASYGLATNADATLADQDSDSHLTIEEWVAMTDPTNRASGFASVAGGGPDSVVTLTILNTLTDRVYDVLSKTGTVSGAGAWAPCSMAKNGTGGNLPFIVTNRDARGVFRFRVERP